MNEMNAGIGALSQPQNTSGGMPRQNMEEMMSLAKKLSDAQLADILSGRSMDVPQFVAMTEAMGRKQLRTAMDGARAQQQAQQPSIREQMLAGTAPPPQMSAMPEEQGIGALPAPNLAQMGGMAGGGIVAFDNGGLTAGEQDRLNLLKPFAAAGDVLGAPIRGLGNMFSGARIPFTDTTLPDMSSSMTPFYDRIRSAEAEEGAPATPSLEDDMAVSPSLTETVTPKAEDTTGATTRPAPSSVAAQTTPTSAESEAAPDRFAQFESSDAELETSLAQQKEQAQGEFLMQLGASLLTSPTLAKGLGEGTQKALPMLVSNKREANKLRNEAKAFKLDVAKAQEAAELGDQEMAFRYEKLAADRAIAAGALAAKAIPKGIDAKTVFTEANKRISEKLKNPVFASQYNKMPPEQQQQLLLNEVQQIVQLAATVTGGGMMETLPPSLRAALDAEDLRRKEQQATGE